MYQYRYYIVDTNDANYQAILDLSYNKVNRTPRLSIDEFQAIIQLLEGDTEQHPILAPYEELNRSQAVEIMRTEAWQNHDL